MYFIEKYFCVDIIFIMHMSRFVYIYNTANDFIIDCNKRKKWKDLYENTSIIGFYFLYPVPQRFSIQTF